MQAEVLQEIEEKWDSNDVFIINLPVASGKSAIATTIANWANKEKYRQSAIITPTKLLVDQYLEDYPKLPVLKSRDDYTCKNYDRSCGKTKDREGGYCKGCSYTSGIRKAKAVPYVLANNYTYWAHKLHRSCLIADEAHNLISMLRDLNAFKLWWHDYQWPISITNYKQLYSWLERHEDRDSDKKLKTLWKDLNSGKPRYLVDHTWEPFGHRREQRRLLKITPIDVKDIATEKAHPLWPPKTRKIVLLSATLSHKDVEQLGLGHKRVHIIHANSPITAENRPIINRYVDRLTYQNKEEKVPLFASEIKQLMEENSGRGIVHITYSLIPLLQECLDDPRLIWHGKQDKMEQFQLFRESQNGVLMACGLQEGIDLPYDEARWQAICKVPWPSLGEPAVQYMAEQDPEWFAWEAVRQILQASGRVCRQLDDFGTTYILDKTFESLYRRNSNLFPGWWKEAVKYEEVRYENS